MNNLKVGILIAIVAVLTISSFYYFYIRRLAQTPNVSLEQTQSPKTNFPSVTASASPAAEAQSNQNQGQVAGANFPSTQPETGEGQTQIQNVGITITSPQNQAQISSPATVNGSANVPNGLVVEVQDANGQILGIRKVNACFGYQSCPFKTSVVFSQPQTQTGTIVVYSPSLTTQNPEYQSIVNVTFK